MLGFVIATVLTLQSVDTQFFGNYYCRPGRDVVVQLFEWKCSDVAKECAWLASLDFCVVHVCWHQLNIRWLYYTG